MVGRTYLGHIIAMGITGGLAHECLLWTFYQRVSIASYASAGIARTEMSVCLSVRHTPVLYQNEES